MNIILNDKARKDYEIDINLISVLCPDTFAKKIPRANVQQAFVLNQVMKLIPLELKNNLLCVGSFEDTACEALIKIGYDITAIDPCINMSLDTFYKSNKDKFDTIFSTSVIEHVEDDELFLDQICKLLCSSGYGILTCDFNDSWEHGMPKPNEDYRLYTKYDLLQRFNNILISNDCELVGDIDYDAEPDFIYNGHLYSFATYVFKKK